MNRLLTETAFEQYNMHKVELFTRAENVAAIRSAEKNGYKIEGRLSETVYFNGKFHDGVLMGLLRDDYTSPHSPGSPSIKFAEVSRGPSCFECTEELGE